MAQQRSDFQITACWVTTDNQVNQMHPGCWSPGGRSVLCGELENAHRDGVVLTQPGWVGGDGQVFMMTSLFLLSVNQLHGSSLHLLHWLDEKKMQPS